MKSPLVILTVFYALGIISGKSFRLDFWLVALIAGIILLFASFAFRRKLLCLVLILILTLLAGCLSLLGANRLSGCHIRNLAVYNNDLIYSVSGYVAQPPEVKNGRVYFILRCREIQVNRVKFECCGDILVKMDFKEELGYGDRLTLIGPLRRYKFLSAQNIYLIMAVNDRRQVIRRAGSGGFWLTRSALRLRVGAQEIIRGCLPELPAGILCAMILGQKQDIPWLVKNAMVESGTVHILVVSGFNVGIVAFLANLMFKLLRIRRRARIILTAFCLIFYCLFTGASNPVIRATVMGLVFLSAYFLKREPDIYNTLSCAALFILMPSPLQLFDLGFQLSFSSVLAIAYFYPRLHGGLRLADCRNKVLRFFSEGCLVSLSAWLGTIGILAWNFRIITPVTVLANLFIVPLATLITLCGFAMLLAGLACLPLAVIFSLPTAALITLLLKINYALIRLPFACVHF